MSTDRRHSRERPRDDAERDVTRGDRWPPAAPPIAPTENESRRIVAALRTAADPASRCPERREAEQMFSAAALVLALDGETTGIQRAYLRHGRRRPKDPAAARAAIDSMRSLARSTSRSTTSGRFRGRFDAASAETDRCSGPSGADDVARCTGGNVSCPEQASTIRHDTNPGVPVWKPWGGQLRAGIRPLQGRHQAPRRSARLQATRGRRPRHRPAAGQRPRAVRMR